MYYQKFLRHKIVLMFALSTFFVGWYVYAHHMIDPEQENSTLGFLQPFEVVHVFMEAVKRGELIVFNNVLTPEMIVPEKVDYSFQLASPTAPVINIYSSLVKSMTLPELEGLEIQGVSATLDAEGNIVETRAHVQTQ